MGGFTQDDGYVRGVAADALRGILLRPCRASHFFGVLLTEPNSPFITEVPGPIPVPVNTACNNV
jgi:hypothetical protein